MRFEKKTIVDGKGGQVDTYTLVIPFKDLPTMAAEELTDNDITAPEAVIDVENQLIYLTEEIGHGMALED